MSDTAWDGNFSLEQWKKDLSAAFPAIAPYTVEIHTQADMPNISYLTAHVKLVTSPTGSWIASFKLSFVNGCPSLIISHDMYVAPNFQRKGIATGLMEHKHRFAKDVGAVGLICTVNNKNVAEIGLLKKTKWTKRVDFGEFSLWSAFPSSLVSTI